MVKELPIRNEEIAKFVTRDFLVENATASLNGCHIIVAAKDVANLIMEELRKHNFSPERIGFVERKGSWSVSFAMDVSQFVASKVKLGQLMGAPQRHDDAAAAPSSPPAAPPSPPTSPPSTPSTPPASSDGSALS
jgi:hypothetical protein